MIRRYFKTYFLQVLESKMEGFYPPFYYEIGTCQILFFSPLISDNTASLLACFASLLRIVLKHFEN